MKLIHISDLHFGKRLNDYSLIDDQRYIVFNGIIPVIEAEKPDAVLIAGDVYDKSMPIVEAVNLLDDFLVKLSEMNVTVMMISGNHDSPERMAFGGRLLKASNIFISPVYNGDIKPVTLSDEHGEVDFYLLPFVRPSSVRNCFEDAEISSYDDAVRYAIEKMGIDKAKRNVLITHQYVTGSLRSDSETVSVGGVDNIGVSAFSDFDYVALGHIHRPQNCGTERVRYSGTPLKYSFSEVSDEKSVTIVELHEKGKLEVRFAPLKPLYDLRVIKGTFNELMNEEYYKGTSLTNDYLKIILTDEENIIGDIGKLRSVYKRIMDLKYDNTRTRTEIDNIEIDNIEIKSPFELFSEFYEAQNGVDMNEEQTELIKNLISQLWNDDEEEAKS